jgi:excisionase family DNA binding protein
MPNKATSPKLCVTPQEAANMLSLSRSVIYNLMAWGEIRYLKSGRARRIPVHELERWITEKLVA